MRHFIYLEGQAPKAYTTLDGSVWEETYSLEGAGALDAYPEQSKTYTVDNNGIWWVTVSTSEGDDNHLFKAPQGYSVHLFPVKGWKLLLSRTIAIVAQDAVGLILSVSAVTYLALKLGGVGERVSEYVGAETYICGALLFIVAYLLIVLAAAFARTLSASVFFKLKGRGVLSLLVTIAALYALSFLNFLAAPFGFVQNYGSMFHITVGAGLSAGMIAYMLANLLQCAALFLASSYLMERKINL